MKLSNRKKTKILILSSMGIGDFIMFTPVLRNLKTVSKNVTIDVVCTHKNEVELFRSSQYINKIILLNPPYFRYKMLKIEEKKYSLIKAFCETLLYAVKWLLILFKITVKRYSISLTHFNCSNRADIALISLFSFSKYRVGYVSGTDYNNRFDFCYNKKIAINSRYSFRRINLQLLEKLNLKELNTYPEFYFSDENMAIIKEFMANNFKQELPLIIISPGVSFFKKKQWPYKKFAEVANIINNTGKYNVIVTGTSSDLEIVRYLDSDSNIVNAISNFTIGEFAALISKSSLLVCCEGGAMHIADALNKKAIAIYGPQNRTWAMPYHKENICMIYEYVDCYPCNDFKKHKRMKECSDVKCIDSISVKRVMNEIKLALKLNRKSFSEI